MSTAASQSNTELELAVTLVFHAPNAERPVSVTAVHDTHGTEITAEFLRFCEMERLPLTSELEIRHAIVNYTGKGRGRDA